MKLVAMTAVPAHRAWIGRFTAWMLGLRGSTSVRWDPGGGAVSLWDLRFIGQPILCTANPDHGNVREVGPPDDLPEKVAVPLHAHVAVTLKDVASMTMLIKYCMERRGPTLQSPHKPKQPSLSNSICLRVRVCLPCSTGLFLSTFS